MAERVLVLNPHGDDGELGCGGTIAKFCERGDDVYYVAFSDASNTLRDGFPPDTLRKEIHKATKILGVPTDNVKIYDFKTRYLSENRQDILDRLIELRDDIKPTIVLTPSTTDVHQDHSTVTNEVKRAFKKGEYTILGYEQPWNSFTFDTTAFVSLDEKHIKAKIDALHEYESQRHRDYLKEDFLWGWARTRGTQIGHELAEAYEVIRIVYV